MTNDQLTHRTARDVSSLLSQQIQTRYGRKDPEDASSAGHTVIFDSSPVAGTNTRAQSLPEHPRTTLVAILGLLSLALPFLSPVGLALAIPAMWSTSTRRTAPRYQRSRWLTVGFVLSLVITVVTVITAVLLIGGTTITVILQWILFAFNGGHF